MLTPRQQYLFRGHPTSPGVRDFPGVSAATDLPVPSPGIILSNPPQLTSRWTKDGRPGAPRYMYPWPRDMHADPSNLGTTPNGPKQPGMIYRGELEWQGFEPWNSYNEKLRRSIIEAYQEGNF